MFNTAICRSCNKLMKILIPYAIPINQNVIFHSKLFFARPYDCDYSKIIIIVHGIITWYNQPAIWYSGYSNLCKISRNKFTFYNLPSRSTWVLYLCLESKARICKLRISIYGWRPLNNRSRIEFYSMISNGVISAVHLQNAIFQHTLLSR